MVKTPPPILVSFPKPLAKWGGKPVYSISPPLRAQVYSNIQISFVPKIDPFFFITYFQKSPFSVDILVIDRWIHTNIEWMNIINNTKLWIKHISQTQPTNQRSISAFHRPHLYNRLRKAKSFLALLNFEHLATGPCNKSELKWKAVSSYRFNISLSEQEQV